jgi:transcriptional regulator with XRE-family HTH domain
MAKPNKQAVRRKIMGTLLHHARNSAGRSQAELAAALHIPSSRYAQYERGKRDVSLPELELVAELCGVPLGYFFNDEAEVEDESLEISHLIEPRIRRKILGALLRQARNQAGKSQKEMGEILGVTSRRVGQYESGEVEIPAPELETLASHLTVQADYFTV